MTNSVEELLHKNSIPFTTSGKDYVTKCLNPEHDDNNPSFRIDKITGIAHCFSCGFKTNIFKYFGILTVNNSIKVAKLKEKLNKIKGDLFGIEPPKGTAAFAKSFRGISLNTLKKFEACYTYSVPELEDRIMFPIRDITGKALVYVCRHMLSQANPRYVNYPRGATMPLFPARMIEPGHTALVLVEGLFDMLNLYDKGLTNVACCFGTNTLKHSLKEKLLPYRATGVTKIYIMFDGDDAGRRAAIELEPLIAELEYAVEIINLNDDTDPGDLSSEDVSQIIEYIK